MRALTLDSATAIAIFLETLLIKEAKVQPGDSLRDVVNNKNGYYDRLKAYVTKVPGVSVEVDEDVAEHVAQSMIMGLVTLMEALDAAHDSGSKNSSDPGDIEVDEWSRRGGGGEGNGETYH